MKKLSPFLVLAFVLDSNFFEGEPVVNLYNALGTRRPRSDTMNSITARWGLIRLHACRARTRSAR